MDSHLQNLKRAAANGDAREQEAYKRAQQRSCEHDWRGVYWTTRFQGETLCLTKCDICDLEGESTLSALGAICTAKGGHAWVWQDSYFYHGSDSIADLFECKRCGEEKERSERADYY